MENVLEIVGVDREDGDGVIVEFSDGTTARYTVEELIELRPVRTRSAEPTEPE